MDGEFKLSKTVRNSKHQTHFWSMSKNSNEIQAKFFEEELLNNNVIALCYKKQLGFVIAKLITPPEVYDAGLTLMIDDFCVQNMDMWTTIGKELLKECIEVAKTKGAKQILVVCGDNDKAKYQLLKSMNLTVASKWLTASIL